MGLFEINPNESSYVHGKKHFTDVIKNSGPGELLIWKQPEEDFNNNSILIVNPGEQAIFIKNGEIIKAFTNGRYVLSTENYPFISRIRNAFTGGISSFNCFVYFIREADSKEIKWGTDSPIQVRDKFWGIRTDIRARAIYKIKIVNPPLFLSKLIGNNIPFETQDGLYKYFNGELTGKIKTIVAKHLNSIEKELIGLDLYLDELSNALKPIISELFENYGLDCVAFQFVALDIDTSKYDAIDSSQIGRIEAQRKAQGQKDIMDILGDKWGTQQSVDILKEAAANQGTAGILTGIGLGTNAGNMINDISHVQLQTLETQKSFLEDPKLKLKHAKEMLEEQLITQEDYDDIKKTILEQLKG